MKENLYLFSLGCNETKDLIECFYYTLDKKLTIRGTHEVCTIDTFKELVKKFQFTNVCDIIDGDIYLYRHKAIIKGFNGTPILDKEITTKEFKEEFQINVNDEFILKTVYDFLANDKVVNIGGERYTISRLLPSETTSDLTCILINQDKDNYLQTSLFFSKIIKDIVDKSSNTSILNSMQKPLIFTSKGGEFTPRYLDMQLSGCIDTISYCTFRKHQVLELLIAFKNYLLNKNNETIFREEYEESFDMLDKNRFSIEPTNSVIDNETIQNLIKRNEIKEIPEILKVFNKELSELAKEIIDKFNLEVCNGITLINLIVAIRATGYELSRYSVLYSAFRIFLDNDTDFTVLLGLANTWELTTPNNVTVRR